MSTKKRYHLPLCVVFFFIVGVIIVSIVGLKIVSYRLGHTYQSDITDLFQKAAYAQNGQIEKTHDMDMWWTTPDGFNIINKHVSGIELYSFNCEIDAESFSAFYGTTKFFASRIDEIMSSYGFIRSWKNSSRSISDDISYDYIQGYEQGDMKCVFVANPDCGTASKLPMHYTFSFSCTNDVDKNYQEQVPYLKDLGITDAVIYSQKRIGDSMIVYVNNRRSGYYTLAKLIDGKWTGVFSGQDIPPCQIMETYQIPKDLVGDCWTGN